MIVLRTARADDPRVLDCTRRYYRELAARLPDGFDPAHGGAVDDEALAPGRGVVVLAESSDSSESAGSAVGCGAVTFLDERVAEIKRVWVSGEARGAGLGSRIVARLEDEAVANGRWVIRLDTHARLTEAIALYESEGYVRVAAYNENPYAQLWFEKLLAGRS
ncbi:GNAT family N-acetyltransferase [Gordonia shandongensis]|uniref:GNAT family N-acetyltransferase n=1 Tax=Gordonia shandongensis TaxID=376351 RepID=UPI000427BB19|nr:GNAT family N-acetyltransferase [Gordonia shandongensis]